MAKTVVRKRAVKKIERPEPVKPAFPLKELAADGNVGVPRGLLFALRRHIDLMSSFPEWEEKKDPVGMCVKELSSHVFLEIVEYLAYCWGDPGPLILFRKCNCYSPFHDQAFGTGHIYDSMTRIFLRRGKGDEKDPYVWECTGCKRCFNYPSGSTSVVYRRTTYGGWSNCRKGDPKWALYI